MVKGIYTGASGMIATENELNSVANNLANVNTDGYKMETSVLKAFPEMLVKRLNDDGLVVFPLGSYDLGPVVGKMGTGVEFNEAFIRFEQGNLQETGNEFDFALEGQGFMSIMTPDGERYTRDGNFKISMDGFLVDKEGNKVLGENGPIQIGRNNFVIDNFGNVYVNADVPWDQFTDKTGNEWKNIVKLDKLKIVDFQEKRYLKREGYSMYAATELSGPAFVMPDNIKPKVYQGFVEKSNVNPVWEMTRMIEIQRLYEANQKAIQTEDEMLNKVINQVGRGMA
ncbi:MAG: flagellar basal-body rod protein FlgF [Spirochaetes bacterium GWF1_49_6]|jgi:flagellar basal-body rod protein FlgG|nr:MAG: flagellar basal-body rod protein FlgF [Spirochaetes bacterium GWF1_49_6]